MKLIEWRIVNTFTFIYYLSNVLLIGGIYTVFFDTNIDGWSYLLSLICAVILMSWALTECSYRKLVVHMLLLLCVYSFLDYTLYTSFDYKSYMVIRSEISGFALVMYTVSLIFNSIKWLADMLGIVFLMFCISLIYVAERSVNYYLGWFVGSSDGFWVSEKAMFFNLVIFLMIFPIVSLLTKRSSRR